MAVSDADYRAARQQVVGGARAGDYENTLELSKRVRLLTQRNPNLADDPATLLEFAKLPLPIEQLVAQSGQMFGMQASDQLSRRLSRMTPQAQRSVWSSMPRKQQMALESMGYKPPGVDSESLLGRALGPLDEAVGAVLSPVANGIKYVGSPVLRGLSWVGDRPMHLYRTLRTLDTEAQWAGLGGAVLGGLAFAAAIPTAGGSLAALGILGGGALLGASAAGFGTQSVITNPNDWFRAFKDSYYGERTFENPARRRVDDLLGDPRLTGLAEDMSDLDGFDMRELVYELAGIRDAGITGQMKRLEVLVEQYAAPGTAEFGQVYRQIQQVVVDPSFQEAVSILQDGKISPGRDFADMLQLDPDSGLHSLLSGVTDAAFQVAIDPTLAAGWAARFAKVRRYGMKFTEGADAAAEFLRISADPRRIAYDELFLDGIRRNDIVQIRRETPEMVRSYRAFRDYLNSRNIAATDVTRETLHEWYLGSTNLKGMLAGDVQFNKLDAPLMQGIGTMRGHKGIVLAHVNPGSSVYRSIAGEMRGFVNGLTDVRLEKKLAERIQEANARGESWLRPNVASDVDVVPPLLDNLVVDETTGLIVREGSEQAQGLEAVGRALGRSRPFSKLGNVLSSITTMIPAGRSISLVGETAVQDVYAMAELGRYMGMPSWARNAWAETILQSDDVGQRMAAVHGWLANAFEISGARLTDESAALVDEYLTKSLQTYGAGDELIVNGHRMHVGIFQNDQALEIVVPSLAELNKAVRTSMMGKALGIVDAPILETAMTRIWKPAVLLRIGFIPRAAGEEMLAFMFRGGFGGLVQEFGARAVGRKFTYDSAVNKLIRREALTQQEKAMIFAGPVGSLPAHIRPVARMLEKYDFSEPIVQRLDDYADFYRNVLEEGVPVLRNLDAPLSRMFERLAGRPIEDITTRAMMTGERQAIPTINTLFDNARLNIATNLETLARGNRYSWRRMAFGGVNNELLEAGKAFQSAWAHTLANDLSNISAGPYDPGYDPSVVEVREVLGRNGRRKTQILVPVRGKPRAYRRNDQFYGKGFHYQVRYTVEDPIGGELANNFISRIRAGVNVDDAAITRVLDLEDAVTTPEGRLFFEEALGAPNAETMRGAIRRLEFMFPDMYKELDIFVAARMDATFDDVAGGISSYIEKMMALGNPQATARARRANEILQDIRTAQTTDVFLGGMGLNERRWLGQMVRTGAGRRAQQIDTVYGQIAQRYDDITNELLARRATVQTEVTDYDTQIDELDFARTELNDERSLLQKQLDDIDYANKIISEELPETTPFPDNFDRQLLFASQGVRDMLQSDVRTALQQIDQTIDQLTARTTEVRTALSEASEPDTVFDAVMQIVSERKAAALASRQPWFDSWDQIEPAMIDYAANAFLNTYKQERSAMSLRMTKSDFEFKDGTAIAWEMPSKQAAPDMSYEDILVAAKNRDVIIRNEDLVRRWLDEDFEAVTLPDQINDVPGMGRGAAVTADKELADELFRVFVPEVGAPQRLARGLRLPRDIKSRRILNDGTIIPLHSRQIKRGETQAELWRVDAEIYNDFHPVSLDDPQGLIHKARSNAQQLVGRMRQTLVRSNQQYLRAKMRQRVDRTEIEAYDALVVRRDELEQQIQSFPAGSVERQQAYDDWLDASNELDALGRRPEELETMVFRRNEITGDPIPVSPDENISIGQYVDANNQQIDTGDLRFFEPGSVMFAPQGEVMWELVGPMLEDIADAMSGKVRMASRHNYNLKPGVTKAPIDTHRVYRSRAEHVQDVGSGAPDFVVAPSMNEITDTSWDRLVRRGFNKVIGPAIDALAREPMAFHYFAERYAFSRRISKSLQDPDLINSLDQLAVRVPNVQDGDIDVPILVGRIKRLGSYNLRDEMANQWTTHQALSWVRGHTDAELAKMLDGVLSRTNNATDPADRLLNVDAYALRNLGPDRIRRVIATKAEGDDLLAEIRMLLPEGALNQIENITGNNVTAQQAQAIIKRDPVLNSFSDRDWEVLIAAERNFQWTHQAATDYAATSALNDMLPFIDSHQFRTQFAEVGRNIFPFWYAEENFLKRWTRTALEQGPLQTIRKAQLGYAGLKSGGVIQTDAQGRDYFVYPGSTLLIEAVSKVLPGAELPVGAMFMAPTDRLLPGLTAERTGQPAFSPLISLPMTVLGQQFTELQPVNRRLFGDMTINQAAVDAIIPTQVKNFWTGFLSDPESNRRYSSAALTAIAQLEASGQGLPDNASAGQIDEYLRNVRNHARIIIAAQAIAGFFVPGAPQQIVTGKDDLTGLGIEDARGKMSTLFQSFVQNMGIEEGTIAFLETYPLANLHHIAASTTDGEHPVMALLEGMTGSRSGAPLPSTTAAMEFYDSNKSYMEQMPFAGPWLLPPQGDDERSQYAYDQQTINDMRLRQTPEQFLRGVKFREAATPYFGGRKRNLDAIAEAELAGNSELAKKLKDDWDTWATTWKASHPVFEQELTSSAGRQRRATTITEMRQVVNDPAAPRTEHFAVLEEMIGAFDSYKTSLAILSDNRSTANRARTEKLKQAFSEFMDDLSRRHPTTLAFWTSVLRPESNLD